MKKRKFFTALLLSAVMALSAAAPASAGEVYAASVTEAKTVSSKSQTTTKKYKSCWIKRNNRYYWQQRDGSILKRKGLTTIKGGRYYLRSDGSRFSGWKKIKGKRYYFQKNGKMYTRKGWLILNGNKYYINSDKSCSIGLCTIKKNKYYFDEYGRLYYNKQGVKIKNKYFNFNSKGLMTRSSSLQTQCIKATQKFIKNHTSAGMSKSQKFRTCFNYLLWYMNYRPKGFNARDFEGDEWQYTWALGVFQSPSFSGNCYGFACSVAAIAKELGYDPYVIVTTGDHGFVQIDGRYYDNMYGGLFGASGRPAYNVYKKVKF